MPERLSVRLDGKKVVTLTGLYRTRRSSSFVAAHEKYEANLSFVGPDEFIDGPIVKSLTFRPSNEILAVMYKGHRISRYVGADTVPLSDVKDAPRGGTRYLVDVIDHERCQAFAANADRLSVSGHVIVSTNSTVQGQTTHEERQVKVTYAAPVSIQTGITDMLSLCDFMSLMVGEVISPISVSVVTEGAADRWGFPPHFDVHARWRPPGKEIDPQYGRRCLATPMFDAEIYQDAVASWINRQERWSQSYALATVCLDNQREVSRRRFLDAAAWFESIPTFYERPRSKVSREVIRAAATAAGIAFTDGGAEVTVERVQALLSPVNSASLAVRIADALVRARASLGGEMLPDMLDELAKMLPRIRGKFAHGEDAFLGDLGHLVHDATLLFEVLAAALTLDELDIKITLDSIGHPFRTAITELQQFAVDDPMDVSGSGGTNP